MYKTAYLHVPWKRLFALHDTALACLSTQLRLGLCTSMSEYVAFAPSRQSLCSKKHKAEKNTMSLGMI